jgi:hypothetical protein
MVQGTFAVIGISAKWLAMHNTEFDPFAFSGELLGAVVGGSLANGIHRH